mmetsp:Transcript_6770/g.10485  ORF Transcript_6770/g.10485 Transcript_6770/m.10485 type:complete len:84 (-) Transcript_6770:123-374(-)
MSICNSPKCKKRHQSQRMRPDVKRFIMEVKPRPKAGQMAFTPYPIATTDIRIVSAPLWQVVVRDYVVHHAPPPHCFIVSIEER